MFKSSKGFTLIELMIVIAIIGVLTSIGIVSFSGARAKANDTKRRAELKQIQTALEAYYNDNGKYPTTEWVNSQAGGAWIPGLDGKYLKTMPVDPKNSGCSSTVTNPRDGGSSCYAYAYYAGGWCSLSGTGYILTTKLESYTSSDQSQKPIYNGSGTACTWSENPIVSLYTVSNP